MDLAYLKMSGYEANGCVSKQQPTRDISVIVNTTFQKGLFLESAIAAGAAEILHKPVSLKALEEVVRRYLSPLLVPAEPDCRVSVS